MSERFDQYLVSYQTTDGSWWSDTILARSMAEAQAIADMIGVRLDGVIVETIWWEDGEKP